MRHVSVFHINLFTASLMAGVLVYNNKDEAALLNSLKVRLIKYYTPSLFEVNQIDAVEQFSIRYPTFYPRPPSSSFP